MLNFLLLILVFVKNKNGELRYIIMLAFHMVLKMILVHVGMMLSCSGLHDH